MDALKQNRKFIYLGLGVLAFILLAFCPSVNAILGDVSGFAVVFDAKGLGFSRFLMFLTIVLPLAASIISFVVPAKSADLLEMVLFAGAFVLGILTQISFPSAMGMSFSLVFCGWFALLLCLAGAALGFISKK